MPPSSPLSGRRTVPFTEKELAAMAPGAPAWRQLGAVEHVFTHFSLTLDVWRGEADAADPQLLWLDAQEAAQGLPSVFRKALEAGLGRLF